MDRDGAVVAGGQSAERRLLQLLIVASIPGAIIGLAFEKQAETTFRSPLLIAIAMAILAVLLWLFDKLSPQKRTMSEMTYWDALVIGFSQALAIIPGRVALRSHDHDGAGGSESSAATRPISPF